MAKRAPKQWSGVELVLGAVRDAQPGAPYPAEIRLEDPGDDVMEAMARQGYIVFKYACRELEARPTDEAAFRAAVREYREGRAPAWLAAWLVKSTHAQDGYSFLKEILRSGARDGATTHAAMGMVALRGAAARTDLLDAMREGEKKLTCEGAAYALSSLGDPADVAPILEMIRTRRIRVTRMMMALEPLVTTAHLVEWFESNDPMLVELGIHVVTLLSISAVAPNAPDFRRGRVTGEVVAAALTALSAPELELDPALQESARAALTLF